MYRVIYPGMPKAQRDELDEQARLARRGRQVLEDIATDLDQPAGARVAAAKALSDLEPPLIRPKGEDDAEDLSRLSTEELQERMLREGESVQ